MRLTRALRTRLAGQAGFTLVEVLVATSIGMVVVLAASNLLDASGRASIEVEDRAEASSKGRSTMEAITARLRSQTCLNDHTPAIVSGTTTSIDYYTVYGSQEPQPEIYTPAAPNANDTAQARRLELSNGTITEKVWNSPLEDDPDTDTDGPGPDTDTAGPEDTFATPPDETRVLADKVAQARDSSGNLIPFLRYYMFRGIDPGIPDLELTPPLSEVNKARTVKLDVAFNALPTRTGEAGNRGTDSTFVNEVFVRTADAGQPLTSPECF